MKPVSLDGVTFSYTAETTALRNVSLSVEKGDFIGVLGPNGSGKSTLIKIINGILHPDSGLARVFGRDVSSYRRKELARLMAVVHQNPPLFFSFSVEETVAMGRWPHAGGMGWLEKKDKEIIQRAMARTEVEELRDRNLYDLSGGERQRVFIARMLAQAAELLLLDEPVAHLDVKHQYGILGLLSGINRQEGHSMLVALHDLNLAAQFCKKIVVLNRGEVVACGTPEDVINKSILGEVFGIDSIIDVNPLTGSPRVTMGGVAGTCDRGGE